MYVEHNKPNWDKLQAISVLTSDSPFLGPALKKNPYIYQTISSDYRFVTLQLVEVVQQKCLQIQARTFLPLLISSSHSSSSMHS